MFDEPTNHSPWTSSGTTGDDAARTMPGADDMPPTVPGSSAESGGGTYASPPPPPWEPAPEPFEPRLEWADSDEPLPVCDYTGEDDGACEEPARQKRWSSAAVVTAASVGAVTGGLLVAAAAAWAFGMMPGGRTPVAPVTQAALQGAAQKISITPAAENLEVATAVAKKVVPSVVSVTIQQAVTDFNGNQAFRKAGTGSGVIIRSDGHILTNYHVVDGADRVIVTVGLEDKEATVVGVDPSTDLAVLKIEGSGYPAVEAGSSKDLQVGQFVMAVGSPFGLEKTVTSGIISALQRSEQAQGLTANDITTYTNLIQTDAAINPGNSGGALVDGQGRLVGLNSLIQSPSGGVGAAQSAGIGFAIPVDFAIDIANQLISTGKATHSYVGISTETVDENLAAQYGLPMKSGALVRFVAPSGPAEQAGIQRSDVIVKIGDTRIGSVAEVFAAIREHKVGDVVPFEVVRGDKTVTIDVTLGSDASRQ
jgi:putative serine protease PepD